MKFLCTVSSLAVPAAVGVMLWAMPLAPARAQTVSGQETKGLAALDQQRARIAEEIASLESDKTSDSSHKSADVDHADRLAELRALDAVYAQHKVRWQERERLEAENKEVERAIDSLDKFTQDEPKPYSFLLWDSLQDQLSVEEQKEKALTADSKSAHKLLATAHQSLAEVETSAPQQQSATSVPADALPADLKVERQRALVALRETEVEVYGLRTAICQGRQKELSQKIKSIADDMAFTAADRDKQLAALSQALARLKSQRGEVESQLQQIEARARTARDTLASEHAGQAEQEAAAAAWQAAADADESQIVILDERIDWQDRVRRLWRRRYEVAAQEADAARLETWREELSEFRDDLSDNLRSLEARIAAVRARQSSTGQTASHPLSVAATDGRGSDQWHKQRETRDQAVAELCAASIAEGESLLRLIDRFDKELAAQLPKKIEPWLGIPALDHLLGYEVVGADDHAVTFGTLVVLMMYVVVGVFAAWAFSRLFRWLVLRHFHLHRGKADAIHSILFYSLCVVFGVLAFRVLDIPLAAFAFLGGAVAIAIGFGSQDIMNNFMSGIILLAEQPIRVGDIVTLGKVSGVVLHIGLRSTRLQTEANHEVIVPNKALLDEQITNFTLTDNIVQVSAVITLDREVKIAEAKEQILKVVFAHPIVVKSMQPLVLVKEIDNYWLTFEVRFWIQYNNFQQSAVVQSQIMEIVGDLYRPLTDEEKATRSTNATVDSAADDSEPPDVPADKLSDPDESEPAAVPPASACEASLMQSAQAKNLSRKLIRKIAHK